MIEVGQTVYFEDGNKIREGKIVTLGIMVHPNKIGDMEFRVPMCSSNKDELILSQIEMRKNKIKRLQKEIDNLDTEFTKTDLIK